MDQSMKRCYRARRSVRGTPAIAKPLVCAGLLVAVGLCGGCGCSDALKVETYPVKGQIALGGKPAPGASIMLLPADAKDDDPATPPAILIGGIADENGEFELVTNGTKKGAPAGSYLVAVSWPDPKVEPDRDGGERGRDLMPAKFRNPRTSNLSYEVLPDSSSQEPLKLNLQK